MLCHDRAWVTSPAEALIAPALSPGHENVMREGRSSGVAQGKAAGIDTGQGARMASWPWSHSKSGEEEKEEGDGLLQKPRAHCRIQPIWGDEGCPFFLSKPGSRSGEGTAPAFILGPACRAGQSTPWLSHYYLTSKSCAAKQGD